MIGHSGPLWGVGRHWGRKMATGTLISVVAACGYGGQLSYQSNSLEPVAGVFAQATQQLIEMGYHVIDANKEAGFIRAERQASGGLPWAKRIDILSLSFSSDDDGTIITVVAATDMIPATGKRRTHKLSREAKADAAYLANTLSKDMR